MPLKPRIQIKILLIEPEAIVRAAMKLLLESWPEFKVSGEASSSEEGVRLANSNHFDVVLLELDPSGEQNGLESIAKISLREGAKIIFLTRRHEPELHREALLRGVRGLVLKTMNAEELRAAILKVHDGEVWLDAKLATTIIAAPRPDERRGENEPKSIQVPALLTKREGQLAELVGRGLSNKEIASMLYVSESTVRNHLTSVFRKLSVSGRLELIIGMYQRRPPSQAHAVLFKSHENTIDPGKL
ncbi:MAG: response regulator transcription factor [Terriglobia bacterium]